MRGLVRTLRQLSINGSTKSGQLHNPFPLLFFQKPYSTQVGGGIEEKKKHDSSCPDFFVSHDREFHVTEDELLYQECFQKINFNKMKVKCHKYSSRHPTQGSNFMAEKLSPQGKRGNGGDQSKYAAQAVRALPIRILTVGKKMSAGVQLIVDDYIQKLKHYCPIEDVRIKSNPKNVRDAAVQIEHEDMAVMGLIKSNDWVVMLDEHGLNLDSHQMASLIADAGNTGASSILFCIGGPYGHGRQLRERADVSIRLSSLVLNHEIALVVLAEQLYRSWTILKGQKYHH